MWKFNFTTRFDMKTCDLDSIWIYHDLICDLNKSQVSVSYLKLRSKNNPSLVLNNCYFIATIAFGLYWSDGLYFHRNNFLNFWNFKFNLRLTYLLVTCCRRAPVKCGMRFAENRERVKCGIFMRNESAFYPLHIFRIPQSTFHILIDVLGCYAITTLHLKI